MGQITSLDNRRRKRQATFIDDIMSQGHFINESDYTGAKFYYQVPFISSSELCSRI